MIRKIGFEGQRVLFGMDRNDAYEHGICIRCRSHAKSRLDYLELESLCRSCWTQLNEISDQPLSIKLSIQVGEHVGDCIAVPPEWDGFTCLNGLVRNSIARDEVKRLCDASNADGSVIQLPQEANLRHAIFLLPMVVGDNYIDRMGRLTAMLKLLTMVCHQDATFTSLLITHFSHEANPRSLEALRSIWHAIYNWHLFKDFGALREIFIGAHPEVAQLVGSYIDKRKEFTAVDGNA